MNMWDMYQGGQDSATPAVTKEATSSFDFNFSTAEETLKGAVSTADGWLDTLGNTFTKYSKLKDEFEGNSTSEASKREYENIEQNAHKTTPGINKNYLVYGGIALAAIFIIKA